MVSETHDRFQNKKIGFSLSVIRPPKSIFFLENKFILLTPDVIMPLMSNPAKYFILFVLLFPLAGCSALSNMDGVMRLKAYSGNKDQQESLVKRQNKNFDKLLEEVKGHQLRRYQDQKSVARAFGEPVIRMNVDRDGKNYEVWLYRYSTEFFGMDKIYLYFDRKGLLQSFDHLPGKPKKDKQFKV